MPFVHGKNARVFIDQYDLSRYFNEAVMNGKVEMADVTCFAPVAGVSVAKRVLPGVKDGSIQLKGLFDSGPQVSAIPPTAGSDSYFHNLLALETGVGAISPPTNVETCVSVAPEGSWAPGRRIWAAALVVTQYQIQSAVKNAVTVTADMTADGGIDTGVSLHDPTTSDTIPTAATIAAPSGGQVLPQPTITVNSTTGYSAAGTALVPIAAGGFTTVAYTGTTATTFTGCTGGTGTIAAIGQPVLALLPGTGINDQSLAAGSATTVAYGATPVNGAGLGLTVAPFAFNTTTSPILAGFPANGQFLCPTAGGPVTVSYTGILVTGFTGCTVSAPVTATASSSVTLPPIVSIRGAYAFLHLASISPLGTGTLNLAKLQSSDDNTAWLDIPGGAFVLGPNTLTQFGTGQQVGSTGGPGGYILFIPPGTSIQRFVRVVLAYGSGSTASSNLVTFVRL